VLVNSDIDENSSGLTGCKNCHIRFYENPFCTYHIVTGYMWTETFW